MTSRCPVQISGMNRRIAGRDQSATRRGGEVEEGATARVGLGSGDRGAVVL